jgi:REP element-mobilizing transposase RayT
VDDRSIFSDDFERQMFVGRAGRIVKRLSWRVYALCLMTTHYHLVIGLCEENLSAGMRTLNGGHSQFFNKRHDRRGAVFESRFSSTLIESESHLKEAIRYVALNPVEAGMVEQPQDWPWSTYPQLIGLAKPWPFFEPSFVLGVFSERWGAAITIVRSFVEAEQVSDTFGVRHAGARGRGR